MAFDWSLFDHLPALHFPQNQIVLRQGNENGSVFRLVEGEVHLELLPSSPPRSSDDSLVSKLHASNPVYIEKPQETSPQRFFSSQDIFLAPPPTGESPFLNIILSKRPLSVDREVETDSHPYKPPTQSPKASSLSINLRSQSSPGPPDPEWPQKTKQISKTPEPPKPPKSPKSPKSLKSLKSPKFPNRSMMHHKSDPSSSMKTNCEAHRSGGKKEGRQASSHQRDKKPSLSLQRIPAEETPSILFRSGGGTINSAKYPKKNYNQDSTSTVPWVVQQEPKQPDQEKHWIQVNKIVSSAEWPIFGDISAFAQQEVGYSIVTLTECKIQVIPVKTLRSILENNIQSMCLFYELMCKHYAKMLQILHLRKLLLRSSPTIELAKYREAHLILEEAAVYTWSCQSEMEHCFVSFSSSYLEIWNAKRSRRCLRISEIQSLNIKKRKLIIDIGKEKFGITMHKKEAHLLKKVLESRKGRSSKRNRIGTFGLSDVDVERLNQIGTIRTFKKGRMICCQGVHVNEIYLFLKGWYIAYINGFREPFKLQHMFIGQLSYLTGSTPTATIFAGDQGCTVNSIPHVELLSLCASDPDFLCRLYQSFTTQTWQRMKDLEAYQVSANEFTSTTTMTCDSCRTALSDQICNLCEKKSCSKCADTFQQCENGRDHVFSYLGIFPPTPSPPSSPIHILSGSSSPFSGPSSSPPFRSSDGSSPSSSARSFSPSSSRRGHSHAPSPASSVGSNPPSSAFWPRPFKKAKSLIKGTPKSQRPETPAPHFENDKERFYCFRSALLNLLRDPPLLSALFDVARLFDGLNFSLNFYFLAVRSGVLKHAIQVVVHLEVMNRDKLIDFFKMESVTTLFLRHFCQEMGKKYLHSLVGTFLALNEFKQLDLDNLDSDESLEANTTTAQITEIFRLFLRLLVGSASLVPRKLREACSYTRQFVLQHFQKGEKEIQAQFYLVLLICPYLEITKKYWKLNKKEIKFFVVMSKLLQATATQQHFDSPNMKFGNQLVTSDFAQKMINYFLCEVRGIPPKDRKEQQMRAECRYEFANLNQKMVQPEISPTSLSCLTGDPLTPFSSFLKSKLRDIHEVFKTSEKEDWDLSGKLIHHFDSHCEGFCLPSQTDSESHSLPSDCSCCDRCTSDGFLTFCDICYCGYCSTCGSLSGLKNACPNGLPHKYEQSFLQDCPSPKSQSSIKISPAYERKSSIIYNPFEPRSFGHQKMGLWLKLNHLVLSGYNSIQSGSSGSQVLKTLLDGLIQELGAGYGFLGRYQKPPSATSSSSYSSPITNSYSSCTISSIPTSPSSTMNSARSLERDWSAVFYEDAKSPEANSSPRTDQIGGTSVLKIISFSSLLWSMDLQDLVRQSPDLLFPAAATEIIGQPLRTGKYILVNDSKNENSLFSCLETSKGQPFKDYLVLPLKVGNQCIGVLGLINSSEGWIKETAEFLMTIAAMIGSLVLQLELKGGCEWLRKTRSNKSSEGVMLFSDEEYTITLSGDCLTPATAPLSPSASAIDKDLWNFGLATPDAQQNNLKEEQQAPMHVLRGTKSDLDQIRIKTFDSSPIPKKQKKKKKSKRERILKRSQLRRGLSWESDLCAKTESMGQAMGHLFESLSEGIIVFNSQRQVQTCNQAAFKMLGFENRPDLLRMFQTFDNVIRPFCRYGIFEDANQVHGPTTSTEKEWELDLSNLLTFARTSTRVRLEALFNLNPNKKLSESGTGTSDGSDEDYCIVDLVVSSFNYESEVYYSAVFRDMTQDKVFQEKDTLLAFLSHEIRNPVQAIILGSQLLNEQYPSEVASDMYLAADLLHSVVNDTIDFVQISSRNFQPKIEVFNLSEVLQTCYQVYTVMRSPGVQIKKPIVSPKVPQWIKADRSRISQIVGNLLSNSSKFTAEGYLGICVEWEPAKDSKVYDGVVVISVQDTGCGIPEEEQSKLFKLFTHINGDQPNKHLSTGLGLVLSRRLALTLNGDLFLSESSPSGSIFCLKMPFQICEKEEEEKQQGKKMRLRHSRAREKGKEVEEKEKEKEGDEEKEKEGKEEEGEEEREEKGKEEKKKVKKGRKKKRRGFEGVLSPITVLVVDDNAVVLKVLQRVLCGCQQIYSATNGQEALDLFQETEGQLDLIIMDCLMPVMNGYDAAKMIRSFGFSKPLLALTGNSMETDVNKAKECGFDDVLIKPIRPNELIALVLDWHGKEREKEG